MIFYLTTKENANLLDHIADDIGLTVSKAVEQKNLNRMIVHDVSNFSHISYFAIDLSAISDNETEVLTAIGAFRSMYDSRIVVITNQDTSSNLLSSLMEQEIYNIVTAHDPIGIQEQLKKCFSPIGMSKEDIDNAYYGYETTKEVLETQPIMPVQQKRQRSPIPQKQQPDFLSPSVNTPKTILRRKGERLKQHVTIAVCGTERRMGTTHQALLLTKFLHSVGFKVCYLEANKHKAIGLLEGVYDVEKDSKNAGCISLDGVDMYYGYIFSEVAAKGYDFFVFDFGSFEEIPPEVFLTKDIKIVVGGSKAWELAAYEKLYKEMSGYKDLNFILNFVADNEHRNMTQLLKQYKNRVHFSDYAPYLFEKGVNHHVYSKLFDGFIETSTGYETPQAQAKSGVLSFIKNFKK